MICFSGGSPYQFINIINLKRNVLNNAPGDLLAHTLGGYNDMSTVTQRIKELGIFENVYEFKVDVSDDSKEVLNEELFGLGGNKTSNYINSLSSDGSFDVTKKTYSALYAASGLSFNVKLFSYFGSRNKEFKCYFYDEGIGQYYSKYRLYNNRDLIFANDYNVVLLLKYKSLMPQATGRFLYEPSLIGFANFNKIAPLPKIDLNDKELIEIYNYIFNYEPDEAFEKSKIIFFNSGFFYKERADQELEMLKIIEKYVKKEDFAVKFHPSVAKVPVEYEGYQTMKLKPIPFESFIMNNKSSAKKILISTCSSAMLTPKLVFGLEPQFVYLDKPIESEKEKAKQSSAFQSGTLSILNKVKAIYNNSQKVHRVSNNSEFEEFIKNLKLS